MRRISAQQLFIWALFNSIGLSWWQFDGCSLGGVLSARQTPNAGEIRSGVVQTVLLITSPSRSVLISSIVISESRESRESWKLDSYMSAWLYCRLALIISRGSRCFGNRTSLAPAFPEVLCTFSFCVICHNWEWFSARVWMVSSFLTVWRYFEGREKRKGEDRRDGDGFPDIYCHILFDFVCFFKFLLLLSFLFIYFFWFWISFKDILEILIVENPLPFWLILSSSSSSFVRFLHILQWDGTRGNSM